jgi:hypothetical protein
MSDIDRLRDKLSKLAGPSNIAPDGWREVVATDKSEFLRAVLNEIDETILARNLTFRNGKDASFSLEVANRRLHSVTDATPAALKSAAPELLGAQFSETGDTLTEPLAAMLVLFFEGAEQISVNTAKSAMPLDPDNIGCAAEVIATSWSLKLYENKQENADKKVGAFIDQCLGLATSWVQFDANGVHLSAGEQEAIQRLTELAQQNLSDFDKRLVATFDEGAHCVVIGFGPDEGQSILYVKSANAGAFMDVPSDNLAEIHKLWHATIN